MPRGIFPHGSNKREIKQVYLKHQDGLKYVFLLPL